MQWVLCIPCRTIRMSLTVLIFKFWKLVAKANSKNNSKSKALRSPEDTKERRWTAKERPLRIYTVVWTHWISLLPKYYYLGFGLWDSSRSPQKQTSFLISLFHFLVQTLNGMFICWKWCENLCVWFEDNCIAGWWQSLQVQCFWNFYSLFVKTKTSECAECACCAGSCVCFALCISCLWLHR